MCNLLIRSLVVVAVLVGPALPSAVPRAGAGCTVYPSYPSYAPVKVEVKKVVAVEYVPLAVLVPQFAVGYAPAVPAASPTNSCDERVRALDAKLSALESKLSPPAKAANVLVGRCAACHDAANAASKGKGLTLTQGGAPLPLSPEIVGKVLREVSRGTMPRGGKLEDSEFNQLLQELVNQSAK